MTIRELMAWIAAYFVAFALGALAQRRRHRAQQRLVDQEREQLLEEVLSRKPGTRAEYLAIVERHRPAWLTLGDFLEVTLHAKAGSEGNDAWRAVEAAKPPSTETEHLVRALLEAERARERAAEKGAACTGCPLHCRRARS